MEKSFKTFYKDGLSTEQVAAQIAAGNQNKAPEKITKTTAAIIRDNVLTLFNLYNFIIAVCLAAVGAYTNLFFIFIIILNVVICIVQELRAKKMVESLALINTPQTTVMRNGAAIEVSAEEIVLGDIVVFTAGKQITVDATIQHGVVEVNESLLTGESDPVLKRSGDVLLSGTFVVSGKVYAQVKHVSNNNYATQIINEAKTHKQASSQLMRSLDQVTKFTSFLIIPLGIVLFLEAYYLRQSTAADAIIGMSAALLGMLPKGLMLLITISLGTGVIKLAKQQVLVQELSALESLAYVDMLCLDKTGTITEGKMHVKDVRILDANIAHEPFHKMMQQFLAASDDNNATFTALSDYFGEEDNPGLIATMPFSSERKWSSASFADIGTVLLGAPERLLRGELPAAISAEVTSGTRVLVVAHSDVKVDDTVLPERLVPLAVISLIDPIRKNANKTLDYFRAEGVAIKIISGDSAQAVSAIAKNAGFADYASYIDMSNIEKAEDIARVASEYNIFGRVSPQQKKELVLALKAQGHTVGMTGDGVNDVLALREADCSIAIAEGSDAAKQISQLVLLDSDFAALPAVVKEGRRVVNNITKLASIFFVKTIYSVLVSLFCILTNMPFPAIPIQITLIDLAIEGYPSLFMSFEPDDRRVRGAFLPQVLLRASSNALTITIIVIFLLLAQGFLPVSQDAMFTIMYYLIGFVSILAVYKAAVKLNPLRLFLCVSVTIGFYVATVLFHNLLHITLLDTTGIIIFLSLAALSIICERLLAFVIYFIWGREYERVKN
jgi:cation-transporting ATPase E